MGFGQTMLETTGIFKPVTFHFFTKYRDHMNNYELMVIFTPVLSDDEYKAAQKKFASFIEENGGSIVASHPWGLKPRACTWFWNLLRHPASMRSSKFSFFVTNKLCVT